MNVRTKTWLEIKQEIRTQRGKNKTCIPFKSLAKKCTRPQLLGKYMFLTKNATTSNGIKYGNQDN